MVHLKVRPPDGKAYSFHLGEVPIKIGRSRQCDLRLDDPFASRVHAELHREGDRFRLSDLGSGNGTFLNGHRVGSGIEVRPGDAVVIGGTTLEIAVSPGREERRQGRIDSPTLVSLEPEESGPSSDSTLSSKRVSPVVQIVREATAEFRNRLASQRRDELYGVIHKVAMALLTPASLQEVLQEILDPFFEAVEAERAYLLLREGEEGNLVCKVARLRDGSAMDGEIEMPRISRSIIAEVAGEGRPVLASDAQQDDRFRGRHSIIMEKVRSVMAAPLAIEDRVLGMVYVDSPVAANVFRDEDLEMLAILACVAAIKVENALLLEQRVENERIRQQLESAREIQRRLLPHEPPEVPGYELVGSSQPCGEVGGDYFDFVELPDGKLLLALGDVSGKGMDAALLMSSLHACLRAQVEAGFRGRALAEQINRFVHGNSPVNRFVTLYLAELDPQRHRLDYLNAGHNPPLLLRREGGREELSRGGMPVGIVPDLSYEAASVELRPGDVLMVYSDGISEVQNGRGEDFGPERIAEVVEHNPEIPAVEIEARLGADLRRFSAGVAADDDRTLIILRREVEDLVTH